MSSPTDRPDKPDDQIAEGEFPQRNEQSVPKEGPISDQARAHRPLDTASLRETQFPPRARRPLALASAPWPVVLRRRSAG